MQEIVYGTRIYLHQLWMWYMYSVLWQYVPVYEDVGGRVLLCAYSGIPVHDMRGESYEAVCGVLPKYNSFTGTVAVCGFLHDYTCVLHNSCIVLYM